MARTEDLKLEASIVTRYLIKRNPTVPVTNLYIRAMQASDLPVSEKDKRLLNLMRRYPFLLRFFDAGLALTEPTSEVRRRLFVMFSILESTPEYADHFLSKKRSLLYLIPLGLSGTLAVLQALIGIVCIKAFAR